MRGPRSTTSIKTDSCSTTRRRCWEEVGEEQNSFELGEEAITLRGYLRRFLFTEERINTKIDQLSGGERSRILLREKSSSAAAMSSVLDEPTKRSRSRDACGCSRKRSSLRRQCDRRQPRPLFSESRLHCRSSPSRATASSRYAVGNCDYYSRKRARPVAGVADPSAGGDTQPIADVGRQEAPARRSTTQATGMTSRANSKWKEERELEGMEAAILAAEERSALG